ncbi:HET-domain-containing protein [Armillaria fumosa]|nr:HET-domain-containing protein [Armillaria fumosa]
MTHPSPMNTPPNIIRSCVCVACCDSLYTFGSFQTLYTKDGYSYVTTSQKVHKAAEEGCNWCYLLERNKDETRMQGMYMVTVKFRESVYGEASRGTKQILNISVNKIPHSSYHVYTDPDDNATDYISARTLISQVSSPSTNRLASECLAECISRHELCPKPRPSALPTRTIDCTDPDRPRLVITQGLTFRDKRPEFDLYAALSYVWGETQQHCTRTDNVDSYTRGIDIHLLPQTIKDAIATTHTFGIQYLWIDSLCILQDSPEDKAQEIAQMRNIFRHSYLTIIAASANRVSEGFLQDRPVSAGYTRLPFLCPDGRVGTMFLSPVWEPYDPSQEAVNKRAWCLEERLLSPRALIYASHTLQYHCQISTVNLGNAINAPRATERLPNIMFQEDVTMISAEIDKSTEKELRSAWEDIVQDYTQRALTKPADRLLACSGLADQFARFWGDKYLAGLWQRRLHTELLWMKDYQDILPRPATYRAPSWSWAAVDGHVVQYPSHPDSDLDPERVHVNRCEILHCEVTPANKLRPFGRVTAGVLKIQTVLRKLLWDPIAETPQLLGETDTGVRIPVGTAYTDSREEVSGTIGKVWAAPVQWNNRCKYAIGLIVVPAGEGRFRRVGYFSSFSEEYSEYSPFESLEQQVITLI